MPYVLRPGAAAALLLLILASAMPAAGQAPDAAAARAAFQAQLTAERLNQELAAALDARNKYLADSVIELARQETIGIDAELRARYERETGGFTAPVQRLVQGLWDGQCSSFEGFAGSQLSDLLSIGDVRDLYNQANDYRAGRPTDPLVIGLAAIGIVSTAAIPFHAATSMIKGLAKADRLSPSLRREMTEAITSGLDTKAVIEAVPKLSWWDSLPSVGWESWRPDLRWPLVTEKLPQIVVALKSGVQFERLGRFNRLTGDALRLTSQAGVCGAQDAMTLAQSFDDLTRFARLAEARKGATAAVFKLAGRDALLLAGE